MIEFEAAVLHRLGQPLAAIEKVRVAALRPDDVLVRIKASGRAHTDLEVIEGSLAYPLPIVLGHEGAGIVEAVGGAVTEVRVGDAVVCSWNRIAAIVSIASATGRSCAKSIRSPAGRPSARRRIAGRRARAARSTISRWSRRTPNTPWCRNRARSRCPPGFRTTAPA